MELSYKLFLSDGGVKAPVYFITKNHFIMPKLVVIKPIDKHSWGDLRISGVHKDSKGKNIFDEDLQPDGKIAPRTVTFMGTGIMLDLENPEHEKMFKVATETKGGKPFFTPLPNGSRGALQRFKIENIEEESNKYLEARERKVELDTFINNISKDEKALRRFALIFGLKGSVSTIKANLYKMAEDNHSRPKLAAMSLHHDRILIELIYTALDAGSAGNKTGMWKDGKDLYYWNEIPLALGLYETVAFLKQEKNAQLYQALKDSFIGEEQKKKKE